LLLGLVKEQAKELLKWCCAWSFTSKGLLSLLIYTVLA